MITKEDIIVNSIVELSNINIYASKKQKQRLLNDIHYLKNTTNDCIYGLMTGSCFTEEAFELIIKCAINVGFYNSLGFITENNKLKLNSPWDRNYTSLEVLLGTNFIKAKELVKHYIKVDG